MLQEFYSYLFIGLCGILLIPNTTEYVHTLNMGENIINVLPLTIKLKEFKIKQNCMGVGGRKSITAFTFNPLCCPPLEPLTVIVVNT